MLENNFIGFKIFFGKLFEELSGSEELSFHENLITYFEIRYKRLLHISRLLVLLLGYRNFSFESTL